MTFELAAKTDSGKQFAEAAQALIPAFRERSRKADQEGVVPVDNFSDMQKTKVASAFVPIELGGFGVTSVHDWLVGISKLAQGDGSSAIGINMHLGVSRGMSQAYMATKQAGKPTQMVEAPLKAIVAGNMLICATATERGTDNLHPFTTAKKTDDGWEINGHKMFVTMSPIATHMAMNLRMQDDDGDHLATTMVPINTPGLEPQNDWDSLGMRGSGSQSVKLTNVKVGPHSVRRLGPWGQWSTNSLSSRALGNLPLVAAFLGIAEHAYEIAMTSLKTQKRLDELVSHSPGVQQLVGEMSIELANCRSILSATGTYVDDWLANAEHNKPTLEDGHELMQHYQMAKWVVNRGAISIVDKAMDLAGGGGFMNGHPLSQLYRDVRAGPFMQPHAPTEIRGYVGQVALGFNPQG